MKSTRQTVGHYDELYISVDDNWLLSDDLYLKFSTTIDAEIETLTKEEFGFDPSQSVTIYKLVPVTHHEGVNHNILWNFQPISVKKGK